MLLAKVRCGDLHQGRTLQSRTLQGPNLELTPLRLGQAHLNLSANLGLRDTITWLSSILPVSRGCVLFLPDKELDCDLMFCTVGENRKNELCTRVSVPAESVTWPAGSALSCLMSASNLHATSS